MIAEGMHLIYLSMMSYPLHSRYPVAYVLSAIVSLLKLGSILTYPLLSSVMFLSSCPCYKCPLRTSNYRIKEQLCAKQALDKPKSKHFLLYYVRCCDHQSAKVVLN